jgi:hypothetical protein
MFQTCENVLAVVHKVPTIQKPTRSDELTLRVWTLQNTWGYRRRLLPLSQVSSVNTMISYHDTYISHSSEFRSTN